MPWIDGDAIASDLAGGAQDTGVTIAGEKFPMPNTLPLAFPILLQRGEIARALETLFGEAAEHLVEVAGASLSVDWLTALVEQVYGDGAGKASGSGRSSKTKKPAQRSKRTSRASTTSS